VLFVKCGCLLHICREYSRKKRAAFRISVQKGTITMLSVILLIDKMGTK
jgi:hypothetical protein